MPFFLPFLAAIGGGSVAAGATLAAGVAGAGINAISQSNANRAARVENRDAREWNRQQVLDDRIYQEGRYAVQRADALADYEKQRADRAADVDADREYNSPAAMRKRLEQAGINPLSGIQDPSVGVAGYGAASTAIAQATASSHGIASTVGAPVQALTIGSDLASAFAAYGDARYQEQQIALQKTAQLMEAQRLDTLVRNAIQKPIVGGIYDQRNQATVSKDGGPDVSGLLFGPRDDVYRSSPITGQLELDPNKPNRTEPLWITVYDDVSGGSFRFPNPDLIEMGVSEIGASGALLGAAAAAAGVEFATTREGKQFFGGFIPQRTLSETQSSLNYGPPRRPDLRKDQRFTGWHAEAFR